MRLLLLLAIASLTISTQAEKNPVLPEPFETPSTEKPSTVIGWPKDVMPIAPEGFTVSLFASLPSPRMMHLLPNGDLLVAQASKKPSDKGVKSPNRITLFKMKGSRAVSVQTFAQNLKLPFGMALWKDQFFVAESTRVLRYTYRNDRLYGPAHEIAKLPFPAPQRHWTRDIVIKPDGSKMYIAVGSASNVGEAPDPLDPHTAAILEMNLDGSEQRIFAGGLRNPVSLAWEPNRQALWAVVNERDELGDNLVPDYITSVQDGGFYGWPYAYWGQNEDPRRKGERPDLVAQSIQPDFSVGAHTAALGIAFTQNTSLPAPFNSGALVTQHGSWNSSKFVGYKVIYVPFVNGQAEDGERGFLTGFIADEAKGTVYGRPVSSLILADGSILVTDDGAGKIWKVSPVVTK